MKTVALFAGIAGVELGLGESGHETLMFCEIDAASQAVLRQHFPQVPICADVRELDKLPDDTQLVSAGFPCQDLSQAGRTVGINGSKSGLVAHLFRLLKETDVPHVLIENVPFMLQLQGGQAIHYLVDSLEELGYNWAYRVVDARSFGLPQRRERVFLLASKQYEPWRVLFAEEAFLKTPTCQVGLACGFYWTEGTRGLGWAVDAIPTLKGGSALGIPSPPGVWLPNDRIVTPHISDAERLQGFPEGWTAAAESVTKRGYRWRLVGNAVSVRAAAWVGECLAGLHQAECVPMVPSAYKENRSWPAAAFGSGKSDRGAVRISSWPRSCPSPHLADFLSAESPDLSLKAVSGFLSRLTASSLRFSEQFLEALLAHRDYMSETGKRGNARA